MSIVRPRQIFERLTARNPYGNPASNLWIFDCECGRHRVARERSVLLISGSMKHCGACSLADPIRPSRHPGNAFTELAEGFGLLPPHIIRILNTNIRIAGEDAHHPDTCWVWTGGCGNNGYGRVSVNGRLHGTHRVSYLACVGPIPKILDNRKTLIMHKCDNPPCIRPDHLKLGTYQENYDDMIKKGRHPTKC